MSVKCLSCQDGASLAAGWKCNVCGASSSLAPATLLGAKLRSKIRSHHWTLDFKQGSEELDRLIKDKARLDWLEQHTVSLEVESPREYLRFGSIREAIDAAIQKAPNAKADASRL